MNQPARFFARLSKVDMAKKTVTGIMAAEVLDRAGEIFDYASSVPLIKEWSETMHKASDGKSRGNVREMHQTVAVGKLDEIAFDDDGKFIEVTAAIVDDAALAKCEAGIYTGFSIGGEYVAKWDDPSGIGKRYTANVSELSLVDMPCNPSSVFTLNKRDGSTETVPFVESKYPEVVDFAALEKASGIAIDSEALAKANPVHVFQAVASARRQHVADVDALMKGVTGFISHVSGNALAKGMWNVAQLANTFSDLEYVTYCASSDAGAEGDDSTVPDTLRGALVLAGQALVDMVAEEVDEVLALYHNITMDSAPATVETPAAAEGAAAVVDTAAAALAGDAPADPPPAAAAEGGDTGAGDDAGGDDAEGDDKAEKAARVTLRKVLGVPAKFSGSLSKFASDKLEAMTKAHGVVCAERDELRKFASEAKTKIAEQTAELETLRKTIVIKPNAPRLFAVEKGMPGGVSVTELGKDELPAGIEPVKDANTGGVDKAATLMKAVHAAGPVPLLK